MKKNTKIRTKRTEFEIPITMRIILYLSGHERKIKGNKKGYRR
jgi:hypothetical protein